MAIVNPEVACFDRGQSGTITVTLDSASDLSAWAVAARFRDYNGATPFATKTDVSGVVASYASGVQTWVISLSTTDLNQSPGGHVWDFVRTDSGAEYEIVEPSGFIIRADAATGGPTLTNLSEYVVHALAGVIPATAASAMQIQQLLYASEDHLRRWCNRDFVYRATVTEYYDGSGTPNLCLRRTPVPADGIVSLNRDYTGNAGTTSGAFGTDTLLVAGSDYYLETDSLYGDGMSYAGIVKRIDGVWPLRQRRPYGRLAAGLEALPGCIKVVYAAG